MLESPFNRIKFSDACDTLNKLSNKSDELVDKLQNKIASGSDELSNIFKRFINNVISNSRFYSLKIILDFLSETNMLQESWTNVKHSRLFLMMIIGMSLPEMLTSHKTAPRNYRAFLARYLTVRRDNNLKIDTTKGFCEQFHTYPDSQTEKINEVNGEKSISKNDHKNCSGLFHDCLKLNLIMFKKNLILFLKLYGKLYGFANVLNLIGSKNKLGVLIAYIKDVIRSSVAMSSMYLIVHMYLTMIDQYQAPKKMHYHIGLMFSCIPLVLLEPKNRLGCISQFIMTIYANMVVYYSTPKNDTLWKYIMYCMVILSLNYRGCKRTVLSLI